jgi:hypothetical protein
MDKNVSEEHNASIFKPEYKENISFQNATSPHGPTT